MTEQVSPFVQRRVPPRTWVAATFVLAAGAVAWIGSLLFEELITADMRWGLWGASAVLFLLSAILGVQKLGIWAPVVIAMPLVLLNGILPAIGFPLFWPFAPLWLVSALEGWWLTRRGGPVALAALALLVLLLAGFGGWIIPRALTAALNETANEPAPEIALTLLDGSAYPMDTLEGKVVVLDFFATWCVPCRAELPRLETIRRSLFDRDDIIILVVGDGDSGDTIEQIATYAESSGLDLPFVWDPDGTAHDAFGFTNIPALAVIDREGQVRLKRVGYNAAETSFEHNLEKLLLAL